MNDATEVRTEVREPEITVVKNEAREAAMMIPVESAGVTLQNFAQQVDYAKWMAQAGFAINKDLRENVGACLAVLDMSQRWGFAPYQVARLCYQVNGTMALESQLIHAVIEKFAPLAQRLRCSYEGEGADRRCIVTGHIRGEVDPLIYTSPKVGNIKPKNSPLWSTDVDQQLWYFSSRSWCRKYCPDILMGIYGRDEVMDSNIGAANAIDVSPGVAAGLHERLKEAKANGAAEEGFQDGAVHAELEAGQDEQAKPPRGRGKKAATEPAPAQTTISGHAKPAEGHSEKKAEEAKPEPKAEPKLPKTVKQYRQWVVGWLPTLDSADAIDDRWREERKLRNACGLVEDERKEVKLLVDGRVAALRGGA